MISTILIREPEIHYSESMNRKVLNSGELRGGSLEEETFGVNL